MRKQAKKAKPTEDEVLMQPLSIRFPIDVLAKAKAFADQDSRPLASYVRVVVERHIADRSEKERKTA
jgi:predicted DNA-binding protein